MDAQYGMGPIQDTLCTHTCTVDMYGLQSAVTCCQSSMERLENTVVSAWFGYSVWGVYRQIIVQQGVETL